MSWPEDLEKHTSLESNVKTSDYLESKTAIPHRAGDAVAGGDDGRSSVVSNCGGWKWDPRQTKADTRCLEVGFLQNGPSRSGSGSDGINEKFP